MDARERIIDNAIRLITERGYDAVGVQEIVAVSGLSKPTLYHHFGNKRGLLGEICSQIWADLKGSLDAVSDYRGDLPLALQTAIAVILRFAERRPAEFRLFVGLTHSPPQSEGRVVVAPYERKFYAQFERLFGNAAVQHGNMAGRQREYAVSLVGTVFAYGMGIVDGTIEFSDELVYRVMHRFSHGVYS